jgi:predicted TIM-barrel fold metal-dependent hydrolase
VLYGSNGLSWERYNAGFEQLELDPATLSKVMCDNAVRVFGLD